MRVDTLVGMALRELAVDFDPLTPAMTVVSLVDGPCAGQHASVPGNVGECWQRIGAPRGVGVDTQLWARYVYARRGEYIYSGTTIATDQLQRGLAALKRDGHTHGESYGV